LNASTSMRQSGGGEEDSPTLVHCRRRYADVADVLITRTVFIYIATAPARSLNKKTVAGCDK